MPEEDQGFEVIDKRRVRAEDTSEGAEDASSSEPQAATGAESPEHATGTTDERAASAEPGAASAEQPPFTGEPAGPPVGAREVIVMCIGQLHEIAWSRMGLIPNPVSGTLATDLNDARLAIDCLADLVARLDPLAEPALRREMQTMLSNLRLNFVQQSQRG
jgi:hypothetical protein